jgi:hypothetical protein
MKARGCCVALLLAAGVLTVPQAAQNPLAGVGVTAMSATLEAELVARYGEEQRGRLRRGLEQVGRFWRAEDGDADAFAAFVRANFAGDGSAANALFSRYEGALEQLDGHLLEINRAFRQQVDLDVGPILPIDRVLAAYDPWAHVIDDFFANKLAFIVLLNFPLTTLEERLREGDRWTRRQWAQVRLAQQFGRRLPADVNQALSTALADAGAYISEYNIWMHHLVGAGEVRLFPPKLRLISHWNLRDELKANYAEKEGLVKQRTIARVMERIVTQTIPAVVVNNPHVDWDPVTNEVLPAAVTDAEGEPPPAASITGAREPDTRYAKLLGIFHASRKVDAYSPLAPTLLARRFDEDREIPEARVQAMFEQVLTSPLVSEVAALIESRLGRPLEPFDIWYSGFRPRAAYTEAQLDAIVRKRFPTAEAYGRAMPDLLERLGFSKDRAAYLAEHIAVDASRGAGHAMGALRRGDKARLRTRVEPDGMNYKGFNIAVHEMGHNVEQTFSLYDIDHYLLQGVPNTAFTEALAFVFQKRDLELLGLATPDAQSAALGTLNDFWATYEIAGVALVDMAVWHWMYAHPDATPAALREATIQIAKDVWNRYYAPVFKTRDVVLLGVYSHMIDAMLYLPDYPLGHMIAFQIQEHIDAAGPLGAEFERMARIGSITPDRWMTQATGAPVGPEALLAATRKALEGVGGRSSDRP